MHQMQALAQKQVNPYAYVSNFSSNSAYPCSKKITSLFSVCLVFISLFFFWNIPLTLRNILHFFSPSFPRSKFVINFILIFFSWVCFIETTFAFSTR
jgi:hypothetical protein